MIVGQSKPNLNTFPIVHLVRHGRIPDHRSDQPLTAEGEQEALTIGRQLADQIQQGETIRFFASPTRRTRQTATLLCQGLIERLSEEDKPVTVEPLVVEDSLENLQLYLDGLSYEPVEPLLDATRWKLHKTLSPQYEAGVNFQIEFWNSPDPMGYWLTHPTQAFESPEVVARRMQLYIAEHLIDGANRNSLRRDFCVTHSANLRAFLQLAFGKDVGQPPFCGMLMVSAGQVYYQEQITRFPASGNS